MTAQILFQQALSRAQVLKAAGAGLALTALPGVARADTARPGVVEFPYYPHVQGTYTPERIPDILDMLLTMERFLVANLTALLSAPVPAGLNPLVIPIEQASLVSAYAHAQFLASLGAQPLIETYTAPAPPAPGIATEGRKEMITTIYVGAYMAAARQFAEQGQPLLVKYAYQMGAEHAGHLALARAIQAMAGVTSATPPANKAFQTDLFLHVRDAYQIMDKLGLFGKGAVRLPSPSDDQVHALAGTAGNAVIQRVPNNAATSITFTGPASVEGERS